jgi:hypothetical protein
MGPVEIVILNDSGTGRQIAAPASGRSRSRERRVAWAVGSALHCLSRRARSAIVFTRQRSPREIMTGALFARRFGNTSAKGRPARNELTTVLYSKAGAVFEERQSRPHDSYFGLTMSAIRTRSARVRAPILRIAAPR